MKKKVLALFLTAGMILGLTACGSKNEPSGSTAGSRQTETSQADSSQTQTDNGEAAGNRNQRA